MITVFSKPACPACTTTKLHLKKRGAPFEEVRIDHDEDSADLLVELGFRSMPVVHYGDTVLEGYHPDALDRLAQTVLNGAQIDGDAR
jgi:glutaredoxin-like protein NrdH